MGGSAFAQHQPPIPTPRMSNVEYEFILTKFKDLLGSLYSYVVAPIEAPGKETYGDLDLILFKPLQSSVDETLKSREEIVDHLNTVLGAKAVILKKSDPIISFAIPWPNCKSVVKEDIVTKERYVQVDIQISPSYQDFHYSHFYFSHGDLWTILGLIIKPFGLRVNNRGMYIRIASIEAENLRKSLILLTSDPVDIMEFIGLDPEKWWTYLNSRDELFHYAASCRMFDPNKFDKVPENTSESVPSNGSKVLNRTWTHRERARYIKRPLFAAWIDEFVPNCRAKRLYLKPSSFLTREQIKQEAFRKFNVKDEFEETERKWALAKNEDMALKEGLKGSVPTEGVNPSLRAAGLRILREVVFDGKPWKDNMVPNEVQRDVNGFLHIEKIKVWVSANWLEAGKIGLARELQRSIEKNNKRSAGVSL